MGYSKANRATELRVRLVFGYLNEEYYFVLPRARKIDKDKRSQLLAVANLDIDIIEWAANTILRPPEGFDDFPMTTAERGILVNEAQRRLDQAKPEDANYQNLKDALTKLRAGMDDGAADPPPSLPSLPDRIRQYFGDPACPELKDMLYDLWNSHIEGTSPSVFFSIFPIVARHFAYYIQQVTKLAEPPADKLPFECGPGGTLCHREIKQWWKRIDAPIGGCPKCPLTEEWRDKFIPNVEKEIARSLPTWPEEWDLKRCRMILNAVWQILSDNRDRIPPSTDLLLAEGCIIWLNEKRTLERFSR